MAKIKSRQNRAKNRERKKKAKRTKKALLPRLVILSCLLGGMAFASFLWIEDQRKNSRVSSLKAAIVDGLSEDLPNPAVIEEMKTLLESAGYTVSVFNASTVKLEFIKKIPTMDFSLIVMRLHGGRIRQPVGLMMGSGLFIEPFDLNKYREEYLSGYLLKGVPFTTRKEYFVIPPHYVSEKFEGRFRNSVIIVLSCYSMVDDVLASSLVSRGASEVVGFSDAVTDLYMDRFGLELIRKISRGHGIREAVEKTFLELGPDPETGAVPRYHRRNN